jgi:DNA-binding IclR family transcriptional regulator
LLSKLLNYSKICNIPKSPLYRYLVSLCRSGFLEKGKDLRYTLGDELISIGILAMKKVDIQVKAQPYIEKLNEKLDKTIALSIWIKNRGPMFISWKESEKPININIRDGSIVSLTTSAAGNVFAAFYPEEEIKPFIDRELAENGMKRETFDSLIAAVKEKGYAYTDTYLPGITAVSAPIFGENKKLIAALNVIGISGVMDVPVVIEELLKTAEQLSSDF